MSSAEIIPATSNLSYAELLNYIKLLLSENTALKQRLAELEAMLEWYRNQLFGKKSERHVAGEDVPKQVALIPRGEPPSPKEEPAQTDVKPHKRGSPKQWPADAVNEEGLRFGPNVPVIEVRVPNPEVDALPADQKEKIREEVTYKLAQQKGYVVKKIVREVVKVDGDLVCPAPLPAILPKSIADDSFVVGMAIDKFVYHMPLCRIWQRLTASSIQIARANLTNWLHEAGELLAPVYEEHRRSVLCSTIATMDETPVRAKPDAQSELQQCWFWGIYGEHDEVVFCFAGSRQHKYVEEFLGDFKGTLLTDGFEGYERYCAKTDGVLHALCWAHTRRHFLKAETAEKKLVGYAQEFIKRLYEIEEQIKERSLTGDSKLAVRRERSEIVVNSFFSWLEEEKPRFAALPKSPFAKAIAYALPRRKGLSVFLGNPHVPLDTNHLERENKKKAIGAHNWLFNWSEAGARHMATFYSLLSTCKLHGIDPYEYLLDVLRKITTVRHTKFADLTPRRWKELRALPQNSS